MKIEVLGEVKEFSQGITYEQIAQQYQEQYGGLIALVSADGKLRELFKHANKDCKLTFFTLKDAVGHKTYVRSATMLCLKAIYDTMGEKAAALCRLEFAVGNGTYISTGGEIAATRENAKRIKARMDELQAMAMPFHKKSYPLDEAIELFRSKGMTGKTELFRYRRSSFVNVYEMDGYYDYYYGFMLPNAGYVKWYDLQAYDEGFMLVLPDQKDPTQLKPLVERRKLFETLKASARWGHEIGIESVGELNEQICSGSISDLILVQEAEQERKISEIAREIASRQGVKFIMIAGPSSSGKTSLSHRLSIQLRTLGMTPHPVALDNYFVNREDTPLDENGDYNFECLEAIDVKRFNDDMIKLLNGERVEIPEFNFKVGRREYNGNYMQLGKEDVLVIEGIHGLNPRLTPSIPDAQKFRIYVSCFTSVAMDNLSRISTTDNRLLRRLTRDYRQRGADAQATPARWQSVRRGEERHIFPYQENADVMLNSSLLYEIAVLRPYAEKLLQEVPDTVPEYDEARRLLKFLDNFSPIAPDLIPPTSLLREFIGGSAFLY